MILAKQVEEEELVEAVTVVSQNIEKVAISKYATILFRCQKQKWYVKLIIYTGEKNLVKS